MDLLRDSFFIQWGVGMTFFVAVKNIGSMFFYCAHIEYKKKLVLSLNVCAL